MLYKDLPRTAYPFYELLSGILLSSKENAIDIFVFSEANKLPAHDEYSVNVCLN